MIPQKYDIFGQDVFGGSNFWSKFLQNRRYPSHFGSYFEANENVAGGPWPAKSWDFMGPVGNDECP